MTRLCCQLTLCIVRTSSTFHVLLSGSLHKAVKLLYSDFMLSVNLNQLAVCMCLIVCFMALLVGESVSVL